MKQIISILFFIISSLCLFAQQDTVFIKQSKDWTRDTLIYETDTVIFSSVMSRHILTGTTILPSTHNQMNAKGFGLSLEKVTKSDCQSHGEEVYRGKDNIKSIVSTDSTLTIDINIYDNCCYDFLCDASIDTSAILNLIYQGYGTYCACNCCFGLTFHFSKIKSMDYPEFKSVMLREDKKTLKKIE